jgi:pimeloyl-ACP methyl ester carboxylesterase
MTSATDSPAAAFLSATVPLAADVGEEAVRIAVGDGFIAGNLVRAPTSPAPVAVLFLHGWGGLRSGPHNLLTHFARDLAVVGVPSLRFDFRWRGESSGDGAADGATLDGMAADTLAAAEALVAATGARQLVAVGICSGGNVAIGVLDRLPQAAGLFLLSVYPFSEGDSFGRDARRTVHYLQEYWQKLFRPHTWRKLVRGEIQFGAIFSVLFGHHFQKKDDRMAGESEPAAEGGDASAEAAGDAGSSHLEKLRRRPLPVAMVYGEADPDFQPSYDYYRAFAETHGLDVRFTTIPEANHNFYSLAWKQELTAALRDFVDELT